MMKPAKVKLSRTLQSGFALFVSFALLFCMVPSASLAEASDETADTGAGNPSGNTLETTSGADGASTEISSLLAAGDYAEGRVVAAVRGDAVDTVDWFASDENRGQASSEKLVDTTASTYVAATEESLTDETNEDDTVSIIVIENDAMTTEEMLYALWDDERVYSLEPDYIVQTEADDADSSATDETAAEKVADLLAQSQTASEASTADEASASLETEASTADEASSPESEASTAIEPAAIASTANEPTAASSSAIADATSYQWAMENDGSTDNDGLYYDGFDVNSPGWDDGEQNACGVVALVDSGIDATNPDLDDVLMDNMTAYNPDGGSHGINVSGIGDVSDTSDTIGHGTHCAGIIASEWNDFGTSGVANGVKIVAIRVYNSDGALTTSALAKAYAYLSTAVDNGLNLVAINNSWGENEISNMLSIIVTELGKKGAVSVFSSGNEGADTDCNLRPASALKDNPYAIVVNSSDKNGTCTDNYGQSTTDVLAPGKHILSTGLLSSDDPHGQASYLAETDGSPLCADSFDDVTTDSVKAYKTLDETTLVASGRVGETSSAYYYESGHSLRVANGDLADMGTIVDSSVQRRGVYLKVPATSMQESLQFDCKMLASGLSDSSIGVYAVQFAAEPSDGSGGITWVTGGGGMCAGSKWNSLSTNTGAKLGDDQRIAYDQNGYMTLKIMYMTYDATVSYDLYLDLFAAGTYVAPYLYASGTSMAAPMVTGAAAVAAKAQGLDSQPVASMRATLARQRIAWLKSHVDQYDGRFENLCTTGGQIDLSVTAQKTLPVIGSASLVDGSIPTQATIEGSGFTTDGTVKISGQEATIVSWQDDQVVVEVPEGLSAGVLPVTVTTDAGSCTEGFLLEIPSTSNKALFEKEIALPEEFSATSMGNPLVGLDGSLYVFPQDQYNAYYQSEHEDSYEYGSYREVWRYDPDDESWTPCADLPEQLNTLSATVHDGTMIVCGTVIDWENSTARSVLYAYDTTTNAWKAHDATHVPYAASIVDAEGQLLLVGGSTEMSASTLSPLQNGNIATLDLASGTVTPVGNLEKACCVPQVAADGTDVYVCQGVTLGKDSTGQVSGMQKLTKNADGYAAADISSALPLVRSTTHKLHGTYGLAMTSEGPVISGALVYADSSETTFLDADTFISTDGGSSFSDFGKRVYRAPLFYATSATSGNWLYTMGSTAYDSDTLILRATYIGTPTPEPEPEPGSGSSATHSSLPDTGDPAPTWLARLFAN